MYLHIQARGRASVIAEAVHSALQLTEHRLRAQAPVSRMKRRRSTRPRSGQRLATAVA
jgi:hypothetical protein